MISNVNSNKNFISSWFIHLISGMVSAGTLGYAIGLNIVHNEFPEEIKKAIKDGNSITIQHRAEFNNQEIIWTEKIK